MTQKKFNSVLIPVITIIFSLIWVGLSRIFNRIVVADYDHFFMSDKSIIWHVGAPMAITFTLFYFFIMKKHSLTSQIFNQKNEIKNKLVRSIFTVISALMLLVALYNLFNTGNFLLEHWDQNTLSKVVAAFISIFFVGLTEETIFRGFALTEFRKKHSELLSYLYSMVLFGLRHLPNAFNGVPLASALLQVVSTTIIGSGLYCTVRVTKTLWPAVCLHWIWDFAVCLG